jgi:hypothetical protein
VHFPHRVLERRRVRQPAHVFSREPQGVLEVSPREAEGLQSGFLGGEGGLLDRAWGWGGGAVVVLFGDVLFFALL